MTEVAPLLAGALTDFALADVLQLLELGARSGVLAVDGGPLGAGRVWVRRGRVVEAALRDREPADVATAVAALLELPHGRWTFHAAPPPSDAVPHSMPATGGLSISALLVEAARGRDERAHAAITAAPVADDVPRLTLRDGDEMPVETGPLTAVHLRVLSAVDGARDAAAIASALRCDPERVRAALSTLRALGLVQGPENNTCRAEIA